MTYTEKYNQPSRVSPVGMGTSLDNKIMVEADSLQRELSVREVYYGDFRSKLDTVSEHNRQLRGELEDNQALIRELENAIFKMRTACGSQEGKNVVVRDI